MNLFYEPELNPKINEISLNEEESRHAIKVLRLKEGHAIWLTDGKGGSYRGTIIAAKQKACRIEIQDYQYHEPNQPLVHLAMAPLKNRNRLEWLVEKATEIGIQSLTFIQTSQTERTKVREDRTERILTSAMKQSLKLHKPIYHGLMPFKAFLHGTRAQDSSKLMAHCYTKETELLWHQLDQRAMYVYILIGPEGDFDQEEIQNAQEEGFKSVNLGQARLRTETAAFVALTMIQTKYLI